MVFRWALPRGPAARGRSELAGRWASCDDDVHLWASAQSSVVHEATPRESSSYPEGLLVSLEVAYTCPNAGDVQPW